MRDGGRGVRADPGAREQGDAQSPCNVAAVVAVCTEACCCCCAGGGSGGCSGGDELCNMESTLRIAVLRRPCCVHLKHHQDENRINQGCPNEHSFPY